VIDRRGDRNLADLIVAICAEFDREESTTPLRDAVASVLELGWDIPCEVVESPEGFVVRCRGTQTAFETEQTETLQAVLQLVAEGDRTAERLRRALEDAAALRDLFRITSGILGCLDVEDSLNAVMRSAIEGLRAVGASIWVLDARRKSLRLEYMQNFSPVFVGTDIPLKAFNPHAALMLAGEAWIENDVAAWLKGNPTLWPHMPMGLEKSVAELEAMRTTMLGAPLWREGELSGALMLNCDMACRSFSPSDAEPLILFANAASVVLNNARLHSDTVRFSAELEERVRERTVELVLARDALEQKAQQLRLAAEATASVQDRERTRIAEDLHDRSCQLVAAALFDLQASSDAIAMGRVEFAREKIDLAKDLLRGIDAENRKVIEGLNPPVLLRQGLVAAITREVAEHRERHGGRWELLVSGEPRRLDKTQELAVYRIVQEALNNAGRHASASRVSTTIWYGDGALGVDVEDDGVGFSPSEVSRGAHPHMGLENLRNRAASIGGSIEVRSEPGLGTLIAFTVHPDSKT